MAGFLRMVLTAALVAAFGTGVTAQDNSETLADIRQELSVVYVMVQRLKRELSTTTAPSQQTTGVGYLQRIDAIEAELQRLTAHTEELENRINRIAEDGTNRINDLEFRLVELEGGDLSQLKEGTTLGGEVPDTAVAVLEPSEPKGAELAVGEQADFNRALNAMEAEEFAEAVQQLESFGITYPDGPLTIEAHVLRGDAHAALSETTEAARAYLDAFSGAPNGPHAPEALFKLGMSLGDLGQNDQACVTLAEVNVRFPTNEVYTAEAERSRRALGCP
ncbi:MAG: tol-pal system protein YbgF [Pseudomonadota bacterium]